MVPALAPLFARMTTHIISERFTALEALSFFHRHVSGLRQEILGAQITLNTMTRATCLKPESFWSLLGTSDQEKWHEYRVPPRRWYRSLLMGILMRSKLCFRVVSFVRQTLSI